MSVKIGRCSICGGRVTVPEFWGGLTPPVPTCEECGATEKDTSPVIPMERRKPVFAKPPFNPITERIKKGV